MTKFKILTWLAVVALLLALPVAVLAQGDGQPARPAVFAGTAMVDGEKVADGTMVVAMIGDDKVGSAMTMDSMYALTIPQNPMMDYSDKDITFMIGKLESPETAMWKPDGGGELDLTADMNMMRRGPAMINMGVRGVNTVLVDDNGMTLYAFSQDTQGAGGTAAASACTSEQCLAAWAVGHHRRRRRCRWRRGPEPAGHGPSTATARCKSPTTVGPFTGSPAIWPPETPTARAWAALGG